MLTLAIDTIQSDASLNHINIDCDDGVQVSDFDHDDQQLITMIAMRVEYAKDVFSEQNRVVSWTDGQNEILRLRDENRNIECIYHTGEYIESITLRRVTPLCEWVKGWADDVLAECASYRIDVSTILDVAHSKDVNVKVWVEYHFFPGTLTSQIDGWLCENYNPVVFATYNKAAGWVKRQLKEVYLMSSGECDRPTYTICK